MKPLPSGSYLLVQQTGRDATITIPNPILAGQFLPGLFLLAWLGGWAAGEYFVIRTLLTGESPGGASAFMLFWLAGWTVGGLFAMLQLRRIFTLPKPEVISWDVGGVTYQPGSGQDTRKRTLWATLFGIREPATQIDRRDLASLQLRDIGGRNRLTVDAGAQRIELGQLATDVEREWIYDVLRDRFRLDAPTAHNDSTH